MDELSKPATLREAMRAYTAARVGLAAAGAAISTVEQLNFQLDHALARDAVHARLDVHSLLDALGARGLTGIALRSRAEDRQMYLRRPDLGRKLHADSIARLADVACPESPSVAFVLVDGLSALAVERHVLPLLEATLPLLSSETWQLAPVCVVEQGRVAIADEIGALLRVDMTIVLIGERPGLSSADSLGVYLTWQPRAGRTDAERNCISNIRAEGLRYAEAASRIVSYMNAARALGATGVALKESSTASLSPMR